jgi:hypothetical protein
VKFFGALQLTCDSTSHLGVRGKEAGTASNGCAASTGLHRLGAEVVIEPSFLLLPSRRNVIILHRVNLHDLGCTLNTFLSPRSVRSLLSENFSQVWAQEHGS